jgi:hypothetical protein
VYAVTAVTAPEGHEGSVTPLWFEELAADVRYPRLRASVADTDDPVAAVSGFVAAHRDSAVCMGTHSYGAVTAAALGSVAARVVREVGFPVLLVGGQCVAPRDVLVLHEAARRGPGRFAIFARCRDRIEQPRLCR